MSAEIDPNEEFREFVRYVQELALKAYPNPQRIGCPSPDVIHDVALQHLPADHSAFQDHIVHCSPCIAAIIAERTRIHRRKATILRASIAAGLILLVGVTVALVLAHRVWLAVQSRTAQNSGNIEPERQPSTGDSRSSPQPPASMLLRPGLPRGGKNDDGDYELAISPTDSVASLLLLLRSVSYPQYEAVIQTANGREVWQQAGLQPKRVPDTDPTISLRVPVQVLQNGSYAIRLFARRDGSRHLVDVYSFHVSK